MKNATFQKCLFGILFSGFSGLLAAGAQETRFPMPQAKYRVRQEISVMVPMRDGVRLSTDISFPEGAAEKLPVILIRTPYNKKAWRETRAGYPYHAAFMFAEQGYAVAVQDCRGRFESEGEYFVMGGDPEDGYDTVTWLATQPWSNGNVGTYGCSYMGETQVVQARLRNPHLKAMIPQAGAAIGSAGGLYRFFDIFNGGALELSPAVGWFYENGSKAFYRPPPGIRRDRFLEIERFFNPAPTLPRLDYRGIWRALPLTDLMKIAGAPPNDFAELISHDLADPWWDRLGHVKDTDRFDVPALIINSWYDFGISETLYLFNLLRTNAESPTARENQFIVISPTTHCASESADERTMVGERYVGDARFDFWGLYIRWFDHWLKGIENGVTQRPKVQMYVMGKDEWRGEQEWPLARTQYVKYFFHSDGRANSRFGTGTLGESVPGNEPPDQFVYDPKTPVPSVGGPICCTGTPDAPPGSFDQSEVEMRNDVLVYTTPALEEGLEITGPLRVVLYVSSSARDTDFTGKLVDVHPDGTAYNVQEGILRARYRQGFGQKVWMKPGEIYELKIDLHATSNVFDRGHRIRLEISGSNFPRFDRNLNTGGNNFSEAEWRIATSAVHHSRAHPSHIVLPVIR